MFPKQFRTKDGRIVSIRHVIPEDAAATVAFTNHVCQQTDFLSFGAGEYDRTENEQLNRINKIIKSDNQLFLLAILQDDLAGMINFGAGKRPRTRHSGDFGMSVRKKYWGLGIGSMLLQSLIDWCQETGFIKKINLKVRTDNAAAIRLYERKGFKTEGTITRDYQIDSEFFDSLCMGLELNL